MRALLLVSSVLLLCACASAPTMTMHSSFNGYSYTPGPTSADDPRLLSPKFYMDDDKPIVEPYAAPAISRFHGDNFCSANCQARGGSADYCYRACGI